MAHPNPWPQVIADYRVWMLAAMLSPNTVYLRTYQLRRLSAAFWSLRIGPWEVTPEILATWLSGNNWSAGTVCSYRAMISSFYKWAVITGRLASSPAAVLPKPPHVRLKAKPAPQAVVDVALATSDRRLALMIRLGRYCGMRRGEIAVASLEDLSEEDDSWWILVHGKGAKERWVPITADLVDLVKVWMDGRTGYLFPGEINGHLAPATVGRLVSRHLTGPWTLHKLRHRYGTAAYSGSHDLRAVQELLGHSKPETTAIYTEIGRDALIHAASFAA